MPQETVVVRHDSAESPRQRNGESPVTVEAGSSP